MTSITCLMRMRSVLSLYNLLFVICKTIHLDFPHIIYNVLSENLVNIITYKLLECNQKNSIKFATAFKSIPTTIYKVWDAPSIVFMLLPTMNIWNILIACTGANTKWFEKQLESFKYFLTFIWFGKLRCVEIKFTNRNQTQSMKFVAKSVFTIR